MENSSELNIF